MSHLPPIHRNPLTFENNETGNSDTQYSQPNNSKARQRRRQRLLSQLPSTNIDDNQYTNAHVNESFEPDNRIPFEEPTQTGTRKVRRVRKRTQPTLEADIDANKPPQPRKKSRQTAGGSKTAQSPNILIGFEDDVIDMGDEEPVRYGTNNQEAANISQRELLNQPSFISVPTDKFYLEMEKKFTMQNKNLYEKKQEERMRQISESEAKRKIKEELKFQISTPRTALKAHKFLRTLFLLIEGINIGFLIWQAVVAYSVNLSSFTLDLSSTSIPEQLPYFYIFRDLIMPIHCLSYLFLTICIVDCMDRVDLSKMSLQYFIKCISFQNQFWAIILYMLAIWASLSIIFIDESVYISLFLDKTDPFTRPSANILNNVNTNVQVWKAISIAKAALSLFAWLLYSIFITEDKTYESLEKRDFNLLDDIAMSPYEETSKK